MARISVRFRPPKAFWALFGSTSARPRGLGGCSTSDLPRATGGEPPSGNDDRVSSDAPAATGSAIPMSIDGQGHGQGQMDSQVNGRFGRPGKVGLYDPSFEHDAC